jgi:hypothetical protein
LNIEIARQGNSLSCLVVFSSGGFIGRLFLLYTWDEAHNFNFQRISTICEPTFVGVHHIINFSIVNAGYNIMCTIKIEC